METFKDFISEKTTTLDISSLQDQFSDGGEQEQDDFYYFITGLKNHGLKEKEWMYTDDNKISIPVKYLKFTKSWDVQVVEAKDSGSGFKNTFKLADREMKLLSKGYGSKWEKEDGLSLMYDAGEHVMTWNRKKGELYTDFPIKAIENWIKDGE